MRRSFCAFVSAAAFGVAVLASGSAAATPALGDALASAQAQAYPGEAYTQRRGGGGLRGVRGGGMRMGGGHRGGFHGHRGGGRGAGAAVAGIGLGLGLLGAAIASQQPAAPVYGGGPGWNRYCYRKFGPAFDPSSGTYLGADGYRYPCQ